MSNSYGDSSGLNGYIPNQYMGLGISQDSPGIKGYPISPIQKTDQRIVGAPVFYRFDNRQNLATFENCPPPMIRYQGSFSLEPRLQQQRTYDYEGYSPVFYTQPVSLSLKGKTHKKTKSLPTNQPLMTKFSSGLPQSNTNPYFERNPSSSSGATVSDSVLANKIEYPTHKISKSAIGNDEIYEELKNKIYPAIEVKKYSTSAIDPVRNYLTVFEYLINNQWIIWDYETGYVHLTGIWKAALASNEYISNPNIKADIVKLLESTPKEYHEYIKRIRGGFLKIQGTWLPYSLCRMLARRFSYYIRYQLIPLFGIDFPDYCLHPSDPRFGELKLDDVKDIDSNCIGPRIVGKSQSNTHSKTHSHIQNHTQKHKKSHSTLSITSFKGDKKVKKSNKIEKDKINRTNTSILPELSKFRFPEVKTPVFSSTKLLPPPISCPAKLPMSDIDYRDMLEIVNASKCLQSLSKSNSNINLHQVSPISMDYDSIALTSPQPNYITTLDCSTNDNTNGISSILFAAGLSERPKDTSCSALDYKPLQRTSLKIDDLLS